MVVDELLGRSRMNYGTIITSPWSWELRAPLITGSNHDRDPVPDGASETEASRSRVTKRQGISRVIKGSRPSRNNRLRATRSGAGVDLRANLLQFVGAPLGGGGDFLAGLGHPANPRLRLTVQSIL